MNLNTLKEGQIFSSQKKLCEHLGLEYKDSTDSRKSQLKKFNNYFLYEKQGRKFIIKKVYDKPNISPTKRKGNNNIGYIDSIEKLILDLLVREVNLKKIFLSKHQLLKELKMINDNYAYCKYRVPRLSKLKNINENNIHEFYKSTDKVLQRNLENALDNLRNKSLLFWTKEITVCKITPNLNENNRLTINRHTYTDEFGEVIKDYKINNALYFTFREATDEEKRHILKTERNIMRSLECKNKQEIIKNKKWNEFKDQVEIKILNDLNIAYYYESYKILCNDEGILEEWEELEDLILLEKERSKEHDSLNENIMERLRKNTIKRSDVAYKYNIEDEKYIRRTNKNYISDQNELINNLIHKDALTLKSKLKNISNL